MTPDETQVTEDQPQPEAPVSSGLIDFPEPDAEPNPNLLAEVKDAPDVTATVTGNWRNLHPEQRVKMARELPGDFTVHDGETVEQAADRVLAEREAPAPEQAKQRFDAVNPPISELPQRAAPTAARIAQPAVDISDADLRKLQNEAGRENDKMDFIAKLKAAQAPPEVVHPTPPVAPRIQAQTAAEIEAGRKMNEHHRSLVAQRAPRAPDPTEGKSTEVFRPDGFVPDQKKGQGNIVARDL